MLIVTEIFFNLNQLIVFIKYKTDALYCTQWVGTLVGRVVLSSEMVTELHYWHKLQTSVLSFCSQLTVLYCLN